MVLDKPCDGLLGHVKGTPSSCSQRVRLRGWEDKLLCPGNASLWMICWVGANRGTGWHGGNGFFCLLISSSCWPRENVEVPRWSCTQKMNNDGRTNKETRGGAFFFSLHGAPKSWEKCISGRNIRLKAPYCRGFCNMVAGGVGAGAQKGEPRRAPSGRHAQWASGAMMITVQSKMFFFFLFSCFLVILKSSLIFR